MKAQGLASMPFGIISFLLFDIAFNFPEIGGIRMEFWLARTLAITIGVFVFMGLYIIEFFIDKENQQIKDKR